MYNIMSSANSEFCFFSKLDILYFFSSLIAVNKTSKTTLNSSGESGHPCLVSVLKGNAFILSPLRKMFSVCLSLIAFIMLSYAPFMEKAMATHSSTLAWKIPWMEGPGGLGCSPWGSLGVRHD